MKRSRTRPTVSVVIPVYNVKPYLRECVASVLSQQGVPLEVILVDDGSTDGSSAICDSLERSDERVSVVHQQNGGLSSARNTGVRVAVGEYVLFLDSDDLFHSAALRCLQPAFAKGSDVISLSGVRVEASASRTLRPPRATRPLEAGAVVTGPEFLLGELLQSNPLMMAWLYAWKRSFLLENNLGFATGLYHEDMEWTPRALTAADSVFVSECLTYVYRVRAGSITSPDNSRKRAQDLLTIVQTLRAHYENCPDRQLREAGCAYQARTLLFALSLAAPRDLLSLRRTEVSWTIAAANTAGRKTRAAAATASPFLYGLAARALIAGRSAIRRVAGRN